MLRYGLLVAASLILAGCITAPPPSSSAPVGFEAQGIDSNGNPVTFRLLGPVDIMDSTGVERTALKLEKRATGGDGQQDFDYYIDGAWRLVRYDGHCPGVPSYCDEYESRIYFYGGNPAPYGVGFLNDPSFDWLDFSAGAPRPIEHAGSDQDINIDSNHFLLPAGRYTSIGKSPIPTGPLFEVREIRIAGALEKPETWPLVQTAAQEAMKGLFVPD